jgi:hypothetical protein
MKGIGAGLDRRVDNCAFKIAELCRSVTRNQVELLDGARSGV